MIETNVGIFLPPPPPCKKNYNYLDMRDTCINCLFFRPTREFFTHLIGDVTIAGEELQIFTYARHLWPLSSEVSLPCHIYCDTGHPFIMVIDENPYDNHT